MSLVFITGGTGFLGRFLVERLLRDRIKVRLLVRNPDHPALKEFSQPVECVKGDILDIISLQDALEGVSHVIHSAAMVSFKKKEHPLMKEINVLGTENLVNMSLEAQVKKFIHISSVAALGRGSEGILDEQTKWKESKHNTFYAKTKYQAEKHIFRGIEEGLNAVIVNPSMILGPGNWTDGTPRMFPMMDKGFSFYPGGMNGFVGAVDVAEVCRMLLEAKDVCGKKFILSAENISYQHIFEMIALALHKNPPNKKIPTSLAKWYGKLSEMWSNITGMQTLVSAETASTSSEIYQYDGSLVSKTFDFQYTPISKIIQQTATVYLSG